MKLKILCITFLSCLILSCEHTDETKIKIIELKSVKDYSKFKLLKNNRTLFNIYLDSKGNIVELSNDRFNKFKVAFNEYQNISYIENISKDKKNEEKIWLNDGNFDLIFDKYQNSIKSRTSIINNQCPLITNTTTINKNGIYYLSENKSFSFLNMKTVNDNVNEYIILESDTSKLNFENPTQIKFKIHSSSTDFILLKNNYDKNLKSKNKVDSIIISKDFTYDYYPSKDENLINLEIVCFNKNSDMYKSIYFRLPKKNKILKKH